MLKVEAKRELFEEACRCLNSIEGLGGKVRLELLRETESGADISFRVITELPFSWELREKVVNSLYECLEKFDPYITLHFEWEYPTDG